MTSASSISKIDFVARNLVHAHNKRVVRFVETFSCLIAEVYEFHIDRFLFASEFSAVVGN